MLHRSSARFGVMILCAGIIWFFAVFLPQTWILSALKTDALIAFYLFLEHSILDASFVFAAWLLTLAYLGTASVRDLGITWPFDMFYREAFDQSRVFGGIFLLFASIGIVIISVLIIQSAQTLWITLFQIAGGQTSVIDWGLLNMLHQMPLSFGVEVLVLCIIAPVAEEILFRGFLFQWLNTLLGTSGAVFVSAILFAGVHWSVEGIGELFMLGIITALVLKYTKSILLCILIHSSMNVLFVLSSLHLLK